MQNLFSSINLNTPKSSSSSIDLKFLDANCNHPILNEYIELKNISDGSLFFKDGYFYSDLMQSNDTILFITNLPMGNQTFQLFELPYSDKKTPIVDTFVVPNDLTTRFNLSFPPIPNSIVTKQVTTEIDYDGEIETVYFPFSNYAISQLFGIINFTQKSDIGTLENPTVVQFSYIADIKQIFPKDKDLTTNWEFLGYNNKGCGIFKIHKNFFNHNKSSIIIRYFTNQKSCSMCGGSNLTNDLELNNSTNQFYNVYDFSKLIQDFFKRFLTRKGTNIFDLTEGTQIPVYIGIGKADPVFIDTIARTEIINLVDTIRAKQNNQIIVQGISLAEQIQQINQVTITRINTTDLNMIINLQSLSQVTAQVNSTISSN